MASLTTAVASPTASHSTSSTGHRQGGGSRNHRPTTFSGLSTQNTAPVNPQYGTSPGGPPIPPPPRTSSQRQSEQGRSASSTRVAGSSGRDRERREREANGQRTESRERGSSSRGDRAQSSRRAQENTQSGTEGSRRRGEESSSSRRREENGEQRREQRGREDNRDGQQGSASANNTSGSGAVAATGAPREGKRRELRFGDYILGQTLGEGEFGKVKLGWRRDGGVQVAIKLIRRDTLAPHPNRLSKIYREISILRELQHPNIVKLHEVVETDRHIGIILEYASGGELFDYILTHRYLKDPPACRLFAQLVSGVGYLHKKGIVHRDLKLENLLLDRNRNIIITDFGFANVFNPLDELGAEVEARLENPETVKELERNMPPKPADPTGQFALWEELLSQGQVRRRGDLMATSCGSPCYAAPELVVSDGLYTGRKVDVWSCGVILYAMLAGYLPFDDDPANPEGDNINLLYKYIVSTPLTFPEYVSPHARDLLRRILVPDPRKRADLFEVARHSWLAPYASVVGMITSATTKPQDIANTTVTSRKSSTPDSQETIKPLTGQKATPEPALARSASVREPSTTVPHGHASIQVAPSKPHDSQQKGPSDSKRDNKRATVQVEYVAPVTKTAREPRETRERERERERPREQPREPRADTTLDDLDFSEKLLPTFESGPGTSRTVSQEPPRQKHRSSQQQPQGQSAIGPNNNNVKLPVPQQKTRPVSYQYPPTTQQVDKPQRRTSQRDRDRSKPPVSTGAARVIVDQSQQQQQQQRPSTSQSTASISRDPARGSYNYPSGAGPTLVPATAQGNLQQPTSRSGKTYHISHPVLQPDNAESIGQPSTIVVPPKNLNPLPPAVQAAQKGHKRANTVTGGGTSEKVFGRIFGSSSQERESGSPIRMSVDNSPRPSFERKPRSDKPPVSGENKKSRRFSLLPFSFSSRGSGNADKSKHERRPSRSTSGTSVQQRKLAQEQQHAGVAKSGNSSYPHLHVPSSRGIPGQRSEGASLMTGSDLSLQDPSLRGHHNGVPHIEIPPTPPPHDYPAPSPRAAAHGVYAPANTGSNSSSRPVEQPQPSPLGQNIPDDKKPAVLQKNRKFTEAYEEGAQGSGNSGSSGAARRVMDFFRKRGLRREKAG